MLSVVHLCSRSRSLTYFSYGWWRSHVVGRRWYRDRRLFQRPLLPRGSTSGIARTVIGRAVSNLTYNTENDGRMLKVTWDDGETTAFHAVWLRHNCQCSSCIISSNQRDIDPTTLDPRTTVTPKDIAGGVLEMNWSCGHSGHIKVDWLRKNQHFNPQTVDHADDLSRPSVATELPKVSASALSEDEGVWMWLKQLNEYGLCLLTDLPTTQGAVKHVCEKIYNIQSTIYGDLFDVIAEVNPVNVAYTNVGLGFHSDLPYYESPPGLQLLHCMRNDDCVEGGESVLLDMFAVAEELREKHPDHFDTLTRVPATYVKVHYAREKPVDMIWQRPHIMVDRGGKVIAVAWAPAHEGPLKCASEEVVPYYEAYHCLAKMFINSKLKICHRLQPGEVMTFNNRRMLHSRNGYNLNGGVRHLQGAYVNIDEFKSRFQVLCNKLGHQDHLVKRVFNQQSI